MKGGARLARAAVSIAEAGPEVLKSFLCGEIAMRWVALVLAAVLVLAAGMGDAQAPPVKLALVIGNADYDGDGRIDASAAGVASSESRGFVPDLRNPLNDAGDIRDSLTRVGFRVDHVVNADGATMSGALAAFGTKVAAAPDTAQVVVYYAGHAIQVDGANFLIPVGARLPAADFANMPTNQVQTILRRVAVSTTEITEQLKQLRAPGVNLLVFDACRNNPWETRVRGLGRDVNATRGLAEIAAPPRTVIAFSTAPGRTADDGAGRNSPFAGVLKNWIARPGTVLQMLDSVGGEVQSATGGRQTPWFQSASVGQSCLSTCVGPSPLPVGSTPAAVNLALIGNLLPNDGRPWFQRLAAGPQSYSTQRFGTSLRTIETRDAAEALAAIDVASVDQMRRDAAGDDAFAQYVLGWTIITGKLGPPNAPEAIGLFKRAAATGHPAGMESYGIMLVLGMEGANRRAEGLRLLTAAGDQDFGSANFSLGEMYSKGEVVTRDMAAAALRYRRAAERGHIVSMVRYGNLLLTGNGVPQNGAEALTWFQKAAAVGNADGGYSIGLVLSRGFANVPVDYVRARRILEQAYAMRNRNAANELGQLYEFGRGGPADRQKAIQYYREAVTSAESPGVRQEARQSLIRLGQTPP
jgi:TPR repeat protein